MVEHEVKPQNTYDVDETGFVMANTQSRRVLEIIRHPRSADGRLFPADMKDLQLPPGTRVQDGSREFATVICCICADGSYLDSTIIMKAINGMQDSWFSKMDDVPSNILFGVSPNGWTDNSKAMAWLKHHFGPGSVSEIKAAGEWRMLIFDGHVSHMNREFLSTCLDYMVLPVCLPPHTTHFSQPLDVSIFSPLKAAYSNILHRRTQAGEKGVWKGNFYKLYVEAQEIAFTPENIRSGFWNTGLVPLDFGALRRTLKTPTPTAVSDPVPPRPSTPPPRALSSMSPTEIYAITTPRDQRSLEHLFQSVSLDLQGSNSPRTWRIKHVIEKVKNTGVTFGHERDFVQERLGAATQRHDNREAKPKRRRRIPEEGVVLKDKKSLNEHINKAEAGSRCAQLGKLQRWKEKAAKLDLRVQELTTKKEKYRTMGQEGKKLPASWKSVARLEEEEKKELARFQKLKGEIELLETECAELGESGSDTDDGGDAEEEDDREVFVLR